MIKNYKYKTWKPKSYLKKIMIGRTEHIISVIKAFNKLFSRTFKGNK